MECFHIYDEALRINTAFVTSPCETAAPIQYVMDIELRWVIISVEALVLG